MTPEFGKDISPREWEYLEGVLDQGLVFGAWPKEKGGFNHRIDFFNTSGTLVDLLKNSFEGGKTAQRDKSKRKIPGKKIEFSWAIRNAEDGLDFLDLTLDHLHFKRGLAEKYAQFLEALVDYPSGADEKLAEFLRIKNAPSSEQQYLPTPRNLAARLDTNGFIGILERSNRPLSAAYALVMLGTKFQSLAEGLIKEYGGSYKPQKSAYIWTAQENVAVEVLRAVLPDLRNMRDRAILTLEFEDYNNLSRRKGRGSKQRDLLLMQVLQQGSPQFDRADLLRLGYIEKSRILNANPV